MRSTRLLRSEIDEILLKLADRQYGPVARWQATAAGVPRVAIDSRVRSGWLRPVHPGVWAIGARQHAIAARCMAAVLAYGPDAAVSGRAAAHLRGVTRAAGTPRTIEVASKRRVSHVAGVTNIRTTTVGRITGHNGVPLVSVSRMIIDLARDMHPYQLANVLNELDRRRLLRANDLDRMLHVVGRGNRARRVRRALEIHQRGELGWMSALEGIAFRALERHGQRPRRCNPPITTDIGVLYVDLAWPAQRVCVEVDGDHDHRLQRQKDDARDHALRRAGWIVIRASPDDVQALAYQLADRVANARNRRIRRA